MSALFANLGLLLLQSNDKVAAAVERAAQGLKGLEVNIASYTGITGTFAVIFLTLIQLWDSIIHSYGLAIIFTAFTVRMLIFPLTRMQVRNMKVMQYIQPVQKEINRYYPNRADQNAKMMELYSEYKISPVAGCLPLVIQFPILIGVYRALYDATFAGHNFLGIQLIFPVITTSARNMGHGPDISEIIDVTVAALGLQHQIWYVPKTIPLIGNLIGGAFLYWPALALVFMYAGSSWFLQRTMKKVNQPHPEFDAAFKAEMKSKNEQPQQPDFASQMQRQMGIMNVFIIFIGFFFSAGALIYFVVQNLLMSLEYTLLSRGAEPAFDAGEMKAFIRRPPPPLPQHGAKGGTPSAKPKAGTDNDGVESSKTQGEGTEPEDDNAGGPDRPRRKRRKR
jgi:YidC/Oxa1 family membrane protein insertase